MAKRATAERNRQARATRQDLADEVKMICGCQNPACRLPAEFPFVPSDLDFDHIDPTGEIDASMVKVDTVPNLIGKLAPLAVIEAEIKKCRVWCAFCHRIHTAVQQGWSA